MKQKLLSNAEVLAIILMGLIALIIGGWSVVVLVILAGALVGTSAPQNMAGMRRAVLVGAIVSGAVVLFTFARNTFLATLPKVDAIPAAANTPLVYLGAIALGTFTAVLIAFLRAQPNENLRRYGLLAFVVICAVAFPFFERESKLLWANAVVVALIFTVQALGLNIVAGYAGLLDLGYVAFFAIGGYSVALLASPQFNLHVSFWLVIWVAAAVAAISGFILGAPTLRLRGDYLAIVTLGFGEIVPIVFKNLERVQIYEPITSFIAWLTSNPAVKVCLVGCEKALNITNGTQGINPIDRPWFPGVGFFQTGQYIPWYFLILSILAISAFFISRLRESRIGRAWVAMREDELAASSMGIDIVRTKLTAFTLGAMFSGFAGAFYGSYVSFISPDAFEFSVSVIVLSMVILGGTGSIVGVILGGLIIKIVDLLLLEKLQLFIGGVLEATIFQGIQSQGLENFLSSLLDVSQYKLLFFGLILVVMMLVRPQGLVPESMVKSKGKGVTGG